MIVKSFLAQTLAERRHLARRLLAEKFSRLVPLRFAWSESVSVKKLFTIICVQDYLTPVSFVFLFVCYICLCDVVVHEDKVADAAYHTKDMEDFVGAEKFIFCIEDREF